jgi:hypothetical protein
VFGANFVCRFADVPVEYVSAEFHESINCWICGSLSMGAGASIPNDIKEKVLNLLSGLKTTSGKERVNILKELEGYTGTEERRELFCNPELNVFQTLKDIIISLQNADDGSLTSVILFLLRLSLNDTGQIIIGSREMGLVPILAKLMINSTNYNVSANVGIILSNCSIMQSTHESLMKPELGYLEYYKQKMIKNDNDPLIYSPLAFLVLHMTDSRISDQFQSLGLVELLFKKLSSQGSDPFKWKQEVNGITAKILNFFTWYSRSAMSTKIVREVVGSSKFFLELLTHDKKEGIQATIIAANIYGKEEKNQFTNSLLESNKGILPFLLDVLEILLNSSNPLNTERRAILESLKKRGFDYYGILIKDIASALRNLSISDGNKKIMISYSKRLFSLISQALKLYIDNSEVCRVIEADSTRVTFGGGGKDEESVENLLEFLLQLSFQFDEDKHASVAMRDAFIVKDCFDIQELLEELLKIANDRSLPFSAKSFATTLLNRLKSAGNTVKEENIQPKASTEANKERPARHIMLSYSWSANKPLVVSLGNKLKEMGYDIWRDEEGSSILPSMSGDVTDMMAEAIQLSHMMIIFVSPEYKESTNCRSEANYARSRSLSHNLKLVYVMVNEGYHTRSSPRSVDGWLGFMVGSELWYSLWHSNQVDSTAKALESLIGDFGKRNQNASFASSIVRGPTIAVESPSKNEQQTPKDDFKKQKLTSSGPCDYETAWSCLEGKKSLCPKAFPILLEELGIEELDDFKSAEPKMFEALACLLKPTQETKFRKAMNI